MHYASAYYDPVKAHEYYMKNRELKGRSTSALNDDGKKIWAYTKNNITSEKKQKLIKNRRKGIVKLQNLERKPKLQKNRFHQDYNN